MKEFEKFNPEGLTRQQFLHALQTPALINAAIKRDRCLICCRTKVNEAGICDVCYAELSEKENELVVRWLRGAMP